MVAPHLELALYVFVSSQFSVSPWIGWGQLQSDSPECPSEVLPREKEVSYLHLIGQSQAWLGKGSCLHDLGISNHPFCPSKIAALGNAYLETVLRMIQRLK